MENSFDSTPTENDYIYDINSNTKLYIKPVNKTVSILYFTDELNNIINIPSGIIVYKYNYPNTKIREIYSPMDDKSYQLYSTDNYTIELDGNLVLNIKWNR